MTRSEALSLAMAIVEKSDHPEKAGIQAGLGQCIYTIKNRKWNEENIFAYCNKIMREQGRLLASDFGKPGAPSHMDVAVVFKMSVKEFRDQHYRLDRRISPLSPYFSRTVEEWTALFIEEYQKIKPRTKTEFDAKRGEGVPRWSAVARMHGKSSWTDLLIELGLKPNRQHGLLVLHTTSKTQRAIEALDQEIAQRYPDPIQ